jgi:hypothetical protein
MILLTASDNLADSVNSFSQINYRFLIKPVLLQTVRRVAHMIVVVRDREGALQFYTEKLGQVKRRNDVPMPEYRSITVSPKGHGTLTFSTKAWGVVA